MSWESKPITTISQYAPSHYEKFPQLETTSDLSLSLRGIVTLRGDEFEVV
jgi:hypothetical protein